MATLSLEYSLAAKAAECEGKKLVEKVKAEGKQQLEKELKKKERKANSDKGKSFEEMLAYVDEYGNLSSTPPDPANKIEINPEDIQINVTKREDIEPIDPVRKGTVTYFNDSKGYGFIKDHETQESVFVHVNGLVDTIKENDRVTFEVEMGPKGPNAVRVRLVA